MTQKILIVESDASLSRNLRSALESRGFEVNETSDGKGSVELIRKTTPSLVVLAVELASGQNGYILCGKLKKDDELKGIPVVIVGPPDGFAPHRKLKIRADDYLAKPFDPEDLINRVAALVGLPPPPAESVDQGDEGISLSDLVDEAPPVEFEAEEIPVEGVDAELDMLDAAFDNASSDQPNNTVEANALPEESVVEEEVSDFNPTDDGPVRGYSDGDEDLTQVATAALPPEAYAPAPASTNDSRDLRSKLADVQSSLDESQEKVSQHESRIRELELELEARTAEIGAARSTGGGRDKEVYALRDANLKKDKELLKLKSELHEKEKELVDLQEAFNTLEQSGSENVEELARKDASVKSLTSRLDAAQADKKKLETQTSSLRDEARTATARANDLQSDLEQAQEKNRHSETELETMRASRSALEAELAEANARLEALSDVRAKNEERAERERERREKTRQTLTLALQLLDEPANDADGEGVQA